MRLRLARGRVLEPASAPRLTSEKVWNELEKASFAVTVPVRRGGVLSLVAPIPPATVSFHARATVHPAGSVSIESVSKKLASLLPPERRTGCLLDLVPDGNFLTYGLGVSLQDMTKPAAALAHVPVAGRRD